MMRRRSSSTTLSRSGRCDAPMLGMPPSTRAPPAGLPTAFCIQYPKDVQPGPGSLDDGEPQAAVRAPRGGRDQHARFGRLPFADLFADAVGYAADGYPVSPRVAHNWRRGVEIHAGLRGPEFAEWGAVFTRDGRAPAAGELFRNPAAARTLQLIADSAAEEFYRGEIGVAMAAHAAATGGLLTKDDLARYASTWVQPIR